MCKINKLAVAVFSLAVIQLGCFAAGAPKWVQQPYGKEYNQKTYICGVGEGNKKGEAELNAIEKIASFFNQNVESKSNASRRMSVEMGKTNSSSTLDSSVTRKVSADDLIGIEIVDTYNDPATRTFYVLAVMNKPKTVETYRTLVENNINSINNLLNYPQEDIYSFETFARIDFAADLAKRNNRLLERISPLNSGLASNLASQNPDAVQLKQQAKEIAQMIPVYIKIGNDENNRANAAAASIFKTAGFNTSKNAGERYELIGELMFDDTVAPNKKDFICNYVLDLQLKDNNIGAVILPLSIRGKEMSINAVEAKRRAMGSVEKKLKSDGLNALNNYLSDMKL